MLPNMNRQRKRMISLQYIIRKLFITLGLPYKNIRITKSKKTLAFYESYWEELYALIGNVIQKVISTSMKSSVN